MTDSPLPRPSALPAPRTGTALDKPEPAGAVQAGAGTRAPGGPLVELSGVNKHFGALHVLQDIDLTIARGEVVVVIGPSGSGKSTLCRTINRLETIDTGTITHRRPAAARRGPRARPAARRRRDGLPVVQPLRAQDRAART